MAQTDWPVQNSEWWLVDLSVWSRCPDERTDGFECGELSVIVDLCRLEIPDESSVVFVK